MYTTLLTAARVRLSYQGPVRRVQLGGILLRPFLANLPRPDLILLVVLRDICRERVIGVGRAEKRLYRQ